MNLEAQIQKDLMAAMKAKDEARLRTVRAIKGAILLHKTSGGASELDADGEIKLLQKLVKTRRDSLTIFEQNNREDLAAVERQELEILETYLPKQLSESEIEAIVQAVIVQIGASSMKDMGKVMGAANKEVAGRAEGAAVSSVVKRLLS